MRSSIAARRDAHAIDMDHFEEALDKVVLGGVRPCCWTSTIFAWWPIMNRAMPRSLAHASGRSRAQGDHYSAGRARGVTEQLPGEDRYNYSREYLMARLAVMMGGRAAEQVAIGDITTGAENDLVEATRLARRMVTRWAMGAWGRWPSKPTMSSPSWVTR